MPCLFCDSIALSVFCHFLRPSFSFLPEPPGLTNVFSSEKASHPVACSRLRDGGGKSFSNKKCEKRAGAGERQGGEKLENDCI